MHLKLFFPRELWFVFHTSPWRTNVNFSLMIKMYFVKRKSWEFICQVQFISQMSYSECLTHIGLDIAGLYQVLLFSLNVMSVCDEKFRMDHSSLSHCATYLTALTVRRPKEAWPLSSVFWTAGVGVNYVQIKNKTLILHLDLVEVLSWLLCVNHFYFIFSP